MLPSDIAKLTPAEFQAQLPEMSAEARAECIDRVRLLVSDEQNGRPAFSPDEVWRGFLGLLQCALAARGRKQPR